MLTEEDLYRLLALRPGEHVVGVWAEPQRDAIMIGIEGDETTDLPEAPEGSWSPRIDRPYAMAKLAETLRGMVAAHLRQEKGELSDECFRAIGRQVVDKVFPALSIAVPPHPTVS